MVPVDQVTDAERNEMFALMEAYYENVDRAVFEADLDEKTWVIQVADPITGAIRGFSSQMLLDVVVDRSSRCAYAAERRRHRRTAVVIVSSSRSRTIAP